MQAQAPRMARGNMYLPAMPDMLNAPMQTSLPQRYAQRGSGGNSNLVIRGQAADEPAPKRPPARPPAQTPPARPTAAEPQPAPKLTIPTPEELGLAAAVKSNASSGDWSAARVRLEQLGASHYRLEKTPEGGFSFVCALPYPETPGRQREFEARADSEPEAIRQALEQVEQWLRTQ